MSKIKRWKVSLPNPDGYAIQPFDTTFHTPQEIVLAADHDAEIERLRELVSGTIDRNGNLASENARLRERVTTQEELLEFKRIEIERLREELRLCIHVDKHIHITSGLNIEIERLRHELADAHGVAQACERRAELAEAEIIKLKS